MMLKATLLLLTLSVLQVWADGSEVMSLSDAAKVALKVVQNLENAARTCNNGTENRYCEMSDVKCGGGSSLGKVIIRYSEAGLASRKATLNSCKNVCNNTPGCKAISISDLGWNRLYFYCHMSTECGDKTPETGHTSFAREGSGFCPYCTMAGQNCIGPRLDNFREIPKDYLSSGSTGATYCAESCEKEPGCKVVEVAQKLGAPFCILRKHCIVIPDVKGVNSYAKRGSGMCYGDEGYDEWLRRNRYCRYPGKECTKNEATKLGETRWPTSVTEKVTDSCQKECDSRDGCKAFSIENINQPSVATTCHFLTDCLDKEDAPTFVTYVKKGLFNKVCP